MQAFARHIIAILTIAVAVVNDCRSQHFGQSTPAPDPTKFLPASVADRSQTFLAQDVYSYYQAKSFRDSSLLTEIKQANYDYRPTANNASSIQSYYASYHVKFFEPAFGMVVNKTKNSDYFFFLDSCRLSCYQMIDLIPSTWNNGRPCVRFREGNFGMRYSSKYFESDYYWAPNESFPSHEGSAGWLTGLLMSCINPLKCDTILSRAHLHGWYRQVSGGMWYSDVVTARELGTVTFARLLSLPDFRDRLKALQLKAITKAVGDTTQQDAATIEDLLANDTLMHKMSSLIPVIGDEHDGGFQSDISQYLAMLSLRDSIVSGNLMGSGYRDFDNAIDAFQPVLSMGIDPDQTPCIYQLLNYVETCCDKLCSIVQSRSVIRQRPFALFGHEPLTLEDTGEFSTHSSYPSAHASKGLAAALTLVMIAPEMCDTLLKAGYQYGQYRAIAGTSWLSDVTAGQTVGCVAVGLIASGSDFLDLLEMAQAEYRERHDIIITENPEIPIDDEPTNRRIYTIDGRPATSASRGILVGKGNKILVP